MDIRYLTHTFFDLFIGLLTAPLKAIHGYPNSSLLYISIRISIPTPRAPRCRMSISAGFFYLGLVSKTRVRVTEGRLTPRRKKQTVLFKQKLLKTPVRITQELRKTHITYPLVHISFISQFDRQKYKSCFFKSIFELLGSQWI